MHYVVVLLKINRVTRNLAGLGYRLCAWLQTTVISNIRARRNVKAEREKREKNDRKIT